MIVFKSDDSKAAMIRLERGEDLYDTLTEAIRDLGMAAGTVQVIGGVSEVTFAYFNQEKKEYEEHAFSGGFEIASCIGNVSIKDGQAFLHAHIVCAGRDGATVGGHLLPGTTVYLAEAYLRHLGGPAPVRQQDETLGLPVWS